MIKKIFPLLVTLFLSFSQMACSPGSPEKVAEKFLNSIYVRTDAEEAKKYCDSTTQELIDQATHLNPIPDSVRAAAKNTKINIVDVKENGNSAVVTYTSSKHPDDQQLLTLVKIDDKWLVQYSKAEQYDEEPVMTSGIEAIQDSTILMNKDSTILTSKDSATD